MMYTIARLHEELDRYHVHELVILGLHGAMELPFPMLETILRDSVSRQLTPNSMSPWMLSVPHIGIGVLRPNPDMRRNRDGTRGRIWTRRPKRGRSQCPYRVSSGLTRTRKRYGRGVLTE
jgi:hypothetical protein